MYSGFCKGTVSGISLLSILVVFCSLFLWSPPSTEAAISRAACAGAPEIFWRRGDGWIFNYVMVLQIGKWVLCL